MVFAFCNSSERCLLYASMYFKDVSKLIFNAIEMCRCMKMKYDISTIENCFKTMQDMTDFQSWEDMFKIYSNKFIDEPERMRKEIMDIKNVQMKDIVEDDINFVLMHVTTSAEKCKGIRKNGLHNLAWTYKNDTELRNFLNKYDINIDIDNRKIVVNGNEYEMQNSVNQVGGVGYKFFCDPNVCGCFQLKKTNPYRGRFHIRPEIIYNINKIANGIDLEHEWLKTHKPYVVKFAVPYRKMLIVLDTSMKDKKEVILQTMFNYAFNTAFCNDFSSDYIGILNCDEFVSPEDIISIKEY